MVCADLYPPTRHCLTFVLFQLYFGLLHRLFDVSKQVAGQMFVHGVNVLISGIVAHFSSGNACVLYFLNILLDTTLGTSHNLRVCLILCSNFSAGVAIIYLVLHMSTYVLTEKLHLKGFESGKYGNPPSMSYWVRQTAVYVFSLTTMKLAVLALFALWPGIFKMGEWLLSFLGTNEAAQVILYVIETSTSSGFPYLPIGISTMGLFPIMMNIIQFWLIDSIVKAGGQNSSLSLPDDSPRSSHEEEPLFQAHSDAEDDDPLPSRPHDIENPVIHSRSLSKSKSRSRSRDPKLSISTGVSPVLAAASPSRKDLEHRESAISLHSYPPPGTGSGTPSPASSSASISSGTSNGTKRRRRSPPPPLHLRPRSPLPPASNATADIRAIEQEQQRRRREQSASDAKGDGRPEDWAWDDEGGDNWDDRHQREGGDQTVEKGSVDKTKTVDRGNVSGVGTGRTYDIRT